MARNLLITTKFLFALSGVIASIETDDSFIDVHRNLKINCPWTQAVKYFYSSKILVGTAESTSCNITEQQDIASLIQGGMTKEFRNEGVVITSRSVVCKNAVQERRRLSSSIGEKNYDFVGDLGNTSISSTTTRLQRQSLPEIPFDYDEGEMDWEFDSKTDQNGESDVTNTNARRKLFFRKFFYRGGGRCRLCWSDDTDERRLQSSPQDPGNELVAIPTNQLLTSNNSTAAFEPYGHRRAIRCRKRVIANERFEYGRINGWAQGKLAQKQGPLSSFLGRFQNQRPHKTYVVPRFAAFIQIRFDFYEIDSWDGFKLKDGRDRLFVFINGHRVSLGFFSSNRDEGNRQGTTKRGIVWRMKSLTKPQRLGFNEKALDQKHRIILKVPKEFYRRSGRLKVRFAPQVRGGSNGNSFDESAGFDNIRIRAALCGERSIILPPNPSEKQLNDFFNAFADRMQRLLDKSLSKLVVTTYENEPFHCLEGLSASVRVRLTERNRWRDARPRCNG